jgi:hypothetical protein
MDTTLVHQQAAGLDMEGFGMNIKEADIIRMALEVGAEQVTDTLFYATIFELQRFAELVAAAEREECAKLCDAHGFYGVSPARQIRARSKA